MGQQSLEIDEWVELARGNEAEYKLRRAMRIVIYAIAASNELRAQMVMKGGVLLATKYGTGRHTRDIDFSTDAAFQGFDRQKFISSLNDAIQQASIKYDEEMACKVQSHEVRPASHEANYQTLHMTVGYMKRGSKGFERFQRGQAPTTIKIDYSFNETSLEVDWLTVADNNELQAYTVTAQLAEKFRAMIQQTRNRRSRVRQQDAFDIFQVLKRWKPVEAERSGLVRAIKQSCRSRDLDVDKDTILDPEIRERSARNYNQLEPLIDEELPPFDEVFDTVANFYSSLPWPESEAPANHPKEVGTSTDVVV